MSIGENIRRRRKELDMTLEEVAALVGISRQTMSRYETGIIGNIPSDKIESLAKALRTTPAYIMGWEEHTGKQIPSAANILPMPRFVKKPRLGTIACGRPILAVEEVDEFDDVPEGVDCDFTLKCKGDSMINARIFDGDIVYVKEQPEVENGQIAAVIIDDEATLKKVYYTPGSDRITLRACNPLYADMVYEGETLDQIRILGRAVAFTSTIRE
ncbi:S24 family peptidase [Pseudoflavonifractor phocaeensis]|uniref:LexA family protein n=1 Tax=Pseudoflavonifractor phocaeensis TaxID=1870988 RepID=UPI00313E1637